MNTLKPYVKLVTMMDGREHAWRVSRPWFKEENLNLDSIGKMDLSLNSLRVFVLEIQSSSIFRDLIFALRPIEGWALSTRSMKVNEDTLQVSSEFSHKERDDFMVKEMLRRVGNGESRDETRELLPCSISTKYTISINQRVLIAFCKSIEILNKKLFDLYCKEMLIITGMEKEYDESTVKPVHEYVMITEKEKINGTQQVGEMIHAHFNVKMALASQFLRQHYSKVKIGYWNMVPEYFDLDYFQKDKIDIVMYVDSHSYRNLVSMRAHWVLDWSMDMWGGIVSEYIKEMSTEEFWNFIPNGGGKVDPYYADSYNRVIHEDPGLPCPIMCEWPAMIEKKVREVGESPLLQKYRDLATEGFIKDNPENANRKKYIKIGEVK